MSDFRVVFSRFSNVRQHFAASIERSAGSTVHGVLHEVSDDDMASLQKKEGVDKGHYRELNLSVETEDGRKVKALAFEVSESDGSGRPHPAYLFAMIAGSLEHGLPESWIDSLGNLAKQQRSSSFELLCLPTPQKPWAFGESVGWISRDALVRTGIGAHDRIVVNGPKDQLFLTVGATQDFSISASQERMNSLSLGYTHRQQLGVSNGDRLSVSVVGQHVRLFASHAVRRNVADARVQLSELAARLIDLEPTDVVEVADCRGRRRFFSKWEPLNADALRSASLSIRASSRVLSLIGARLNDPLVVRKSLRDLSPATASDKLWNILVGTRRVYLTVHQGLDMDEGTKTVRLHPGVVSTLGIEIGDLVRLYIGSKRLDSRALSFEQEAVKAERREITIPEHLAMLVPSSERDRLQIGVGDVVQISRSPAGVLRKRADRIIASVLAMITTYLTLVAAPLEVSARVALPIACVAGLVAFWLLYITVRAEIQ